MEKGYKYVISKKIVRDPLAIINKVIITKNNDSSLYSSYKNISTLNELLPLIKDNNCTGFELKNLENEEINFIINNFKDEIIYLDLFMCENDLSILKEAKFIKSISLFDIKNFVSIWDIKNNLNLIYLSINGCKDLLDINNIKYANLEKLKIFDGFSSIPNRLNLKVEDLSIFSKIKSLKELYLFINDNSDKEKDLSSLMLLTNLDNLYLPKDYFTFEQFAHLKSKLTNTKSIDAIYHIAKDPSNEEVYAIIIGKDKPDFIYDDGDDFLAYRNEYDALIKKYKNEV